MTSIKNQKDLASTLKNLARRDTSALSRIRNKFNSLMRDYDIVGKKAKNLRERLFYHFRKILEMQLRFTEYDSHQIMGESLQSALDLALNEKFINDTFGSKDDINYKLFIEDFERIVEETPYW